LDPVGQREGADKLRGAEIVGIAGGDVHKRAL
jgi:hypothetical protein